MLKNAFLLLLLAGSSFAWWDASSPYRAQVNIINAGSALTDFQVNISLNTQALIAAGKMRSDCGDLRIVAANDSSTLPFWIEGACNTTATKIWARVPNVTASSVANTTLYLYYGNPSAMNASNGTNVFALFDDFDRADSATVGNGWINATSTIITRISGNQLRVDGTAQVTPALYKPYMLTTDVIVETKFKRTALSDLDFYFYVTGATQSAIFGLAGPYASPNFYYLNNGWIDSGVPVVANQVYDLKIIFHQATNTADYYTGLNSWVGQANAAMAMPTYSIMFGNWQTGTEFSYFDNIRVRKYASPEPTTSVLAEEAALHFTYRKEILLNNTGSARSDHQINLTINTASLVSAGKMNSDCSDMRFTNSTSYSTQDWAASYRYWIESGCNTTATKIWARVPSIPTGTSTIYVYYGNSSAANASNGTNTFDFFDDFNRINSDTIGNGWTEATDVGAISSNALRINKGNDPWGIYKTHAFAGDSIVEAYIQTNVVASYLYYGIEGTVANKRFGIAGGDPNTKTQYIDGGWVSAGIPDTADKKIWSIRYNTSSQTVDYKWGSTVIKTGAATGVTSASTNRIMFGRDTSVPSYDYEVDFVRVRKYASPEPTATAGTEQQLDTTPPVVLIQSPSSTTYTTSIVPVNFTTTDDAAFSCTVRLNGTVNSSTCSNYTLILANGAYNLTVTANDTAGNVNSSQVLFTVATDTTPPSVTIQSPAGIQYATGAIPVNFTATDNTAVSSCTVRLNGTVNSSTCDNYTLTLANGAYTLNVTANDTAGNMNSTQVSFTVAMPAGAQYNSTQATTDNNGIAAGNLSFSFTPGTLKINTGTQEQTKAISASAGVNRIQLRAKITLGGQAVTGKQVTYTISE